MQYMLILKCIYCCVPLDTSTVLCWQQRFYRNFVGQFKRTESAKEVHSETENEKNEPVSQQYLGKIEKKKKVLVARKERGVKQQSHR